MVTRKAVAEVVSVPELALFDRNLTLGIAFTQLYTSHLGTRTTPLNKYMFRTDMYIMYRSMWKQIGVGYTNSQNKSPINQTIQIYRLYTRF